jgi:hypothetical protein
MSPETSEPRRNHGRDLPFYFSFTPLYRLFGGHSPFATCYEEGGSGRGGLPSNDT